VVGEIEMKSTINVCLNWTMCISDDDAEGKGIVAHHAEQHHHFNKGSSFFVSNPNEINDDNLF
jgi:hypothetical protein